MGNTVTSTTTCFQFKGPRSSTSSSGKVKLIFWGGTTRTLTGRNHVAGEIMFENPDKMVCHEDTFFIGQPIPALSINDPLLPGRTYFILPLDRFTDGVLTAPSLAALTSSPTRAPVHFRGCPFEYVKGVNGRVLIKVVPEFITKMIYRGRDLHEEEDATADDNCPSGGFLSTPELKKHYEQLVRSKDQTWSPKLDSISEYKVRYSPCKFIGLEWREREVWN